MMRKQTLITFVVFILLSISLFGQTSLSNAVLTQDRWYNDEYSFDFKNDGSVVSYYTFGRQEGTLNGKWRVENNQRIIINVENVSGDYNRALVSNNFLNLTFSFNANDPKATMMLFGGPQGLFKVWNKATFIAADRTMTMQPGNTPVVTTGYRLTATKENLRLRQGPGITFDYQTYTYLDTVSNTIKTFGSVFAGTNLRILARTREKFKVLDWYNNWYYVEYKEPLEGITVYRNAWMFGEFLNVAENAVRWVKIDSPANEASIYGPSEITISGTTGGSPVSLKLQIKNSYGNVIKEVPITNYNQVNATFTHRISKNTGDLYIGSNTMNIVALYSDSTRSEKQTTFYIHESQGEMAKPVIYLYPPQEMNVSVKVSPRSGFSKTEPS